MNIIIVENDEDLKKLGREISLQGLDEKILVITNEEAKKRGIQINRVQETKPNSIAALAQKKKVVKPRQSSLFHQAYPNPYKK